jgi:thiosulfate reductase cytochrome b subunit
VHRFLPYRKRHLDALECSSCHAPRPMGPAAQMIDETVVRRDGTPVIVFRGMERGDGATLNTAFATGYVPLLLQRRQPSGAKKLAPFNAVDTWFWASGASDRPVPLATLRMAYLEDGRYAPAVLALFDTNRDGTVSGAELRLDSAIETGLIRARLAALGVRDPVIRHTVSLHPLEHGILSGAQVQRDCRSCHAQDSRLAARLPLAAYTPGGGTPSRPDGIERNGGVGEVRVLSLGGGSAIASEANAATGLYIFGNSRGRWTNRLGFGLFAAMLLGTMLHAAFRVLPRGPQTVRPAPGPRVYLYSVYERVWHWLMAMSILALVLTGIQIEFAGGPNALPLPTAVAVHNFFAVVLTVNAFLSLFYHLATSAIRQFIPPKDGLASRVAEHMHYYTRGMFLGQPHPSPRSLERKLNPLQQLSYLALLNVLFPFQVVTGILIWGVSRWPRLADAMGGLTVVAPLHSLGTWLFLTFFVMHLYLTTTGHTVFSHIRSMIDGYGELEPETRMRMGAPNA